MSFVLVHGVRVSTEELFARRAFCGRCVDVTPHVFFRVLEQEHVYFMSIGAPDRREASACEVCQWVVGCSVEDLDRPASDEERVRRETDAFLRAHADVPVQVRWTPRVVAATLLILAALGAIGWLTAWIFHVGVAAGGLVLGLVPVALFVHREAVRRSLEREVAREIEPQIGRLLARTGGRFGALAPRARQLRLLPLARLLGLPALADSFPAASPYR